MARYHLVLADWQELRKNVNKPEVTETFDDAGEQLNFGALIKNFQDTVVVNVPR